MQRKSTSGLSFPKLQNGNQKNHCPNFVGGMRTEQLWALVGVLVSLYSIYVELHASQEDDFVAFCDITPSVSCSKVLTSPYAKMVGYVYDLPEDHSLNVPNTYLGLLFYSAVILYSIPPFTRVPHRELLFFSASCLSLVLCLVLGYILYAILEDLCLVCLTSYLVNISIFICACKEVKLWSSQNKKE
eukprot:TRINITY_DN4316_c0_g1_i2.p1 TRINITY_DN4316_c0_g1~~TRINITY_DN4316_c0_g1_i2.p1  ORF type:complete len:187 (-),score=19.05 TRINITY_DN4316_c0_g1_i2:23-583(-)